MLGRGKGLVVVAATLAFVAWSATTGHAQVFVACATPTGLHPMPGGIPQPGRPCGNGFDSGYTVVQWPTLPPPQFAAAPMTAGVVAGFVGFNHEHQVAADCVWQFGVTWTGAGCITSRLTADELNKCFTHGFGGQGCFGDNNTLVSMVRQNWANAIERERSGVDIAIRGFTGISPRDMRDEGLFGGRCSFFNNPFGGNGC